MKYYKSSNGFYGIQNITVCGSGILKEKAPFKVKVWIVYNSSYDNPYMELSGDKKFKTEDQALAQVERLMQQEIITDDDF